MRQCNNCGWIFLDGLEACPVCSHKVSTDTKYVCGNCGQIYSSNIAKCPKCQNVNGTGGSITKKQDIITDDNVKKYKTFCMCLSGLCIALFIILLVATSGNDDKELALKKEISNKEEMIVSLKKKLEYKDQIINEKDEEIAKKDKEIAEAINKTVFGKTTEDLYRVYDKHGYVLRDKVDVRMGPGLLYPGKTVLYKGDRVDVLGYSIDISSVAWYKISYKGKNGEKSEGFVLRQYLQTY